MEKRLAKIIKEEVDEFMKTLDSHLEDTEERLTNKLDYLKKSFGTIPSNRPEERRFKDAEKKDAEAELKDVKDMEKDMEEKAKDLKKAKEASDSSNILNSPTTNTTTTVTGNIS